MTPIARNYLNFATPLQNLGSYLLGNLDKVSRIAIPLLVALTATGLALYYFRNRAVRTNVCEKIPTPEKPKLPSPPQAKMVPYSSIRVSNTVEPLSQVGQEAVAFAKKSVLSRTGLPEIFLGETRSTRGEIEKMAAIYQEKYEALKKLTLSKDKSTFWHDQEVLNLADELMSLAFAISNNTLEELSLYLSINKHDNLKSLMDVNSYKIYGAVQCARAYRFLRYASVIDVNHDKGKIFFSHPAHQIPEVLSAPFYTEGSLQYKWRTLHNELRTRLEMYVDPIDLKNSKEFSLQQLNRWTTQDNTLESYSSRPQKLPWSDPLEGLL